MTEQATSALLIDGQAPAEVPLHHVWNECVGAGRANEALRALLRMPYTFQGR